MKLNRCLNLSKKKHNFGLPRLQLESNPRVDFRSLIFQVKKFEDDKIFT